MFEHLAVQRDSRKGAAGARIGENFRPELHVRGALGAAANRSAGRGSVRADLGLVTQKGVRAPGVHHEQDKFRGLAAKLQSDVEAADREHGRRAPGTVAPFPANQRPASIGGPQADGAFLFGRNDAHTNRFVDQFRGNALIGRVHDVRNDFRRHFQARRFLVVRPADAHCSPQYEEKNYRPCVSHLKNLH